MNNFSSVVEPKVEVATHSEATTLAERFNAVVTESKVAAECIEDVVWDDLPERERTARLLFAMTGSASRAARYRDCERYAVPVVCLGCESKYYSRYRCGSRFCEHCGPSHFLRLMERYREPISQMIASQQSQRGQTLAKVTFTMRARDCMPEREEPRRLNRLVREWFGRMHDRCRCGHLKTFHQIEHFRNGRACYRNCADCSCSRCSAASAKPVWGCVFAVETGHELARKHQDRVAGGWNLHVHVLFYGPYIDFKEGMGVWQELLGYPAGIRVEECREWRKKPDLAVRRALAHHFGYVMKPAAVSPERIAELEVLFAGTRRIHALGAFFRLPVKPRDAAGPCCPRCREPLPINLRAWRKGERHPVELLDAEGYQDLRRVTRELLRAQALGARSP